VSHLETMKNILTKSPLATASVVSIGTYFLVGSLKKKKSVTAQSIWAACVGVVTYEFIDFGNSFS